MDVESMDGLYEAFVCTGCSCLCDDICVRVKANRIEGLTNICSTGKDRLLWEEEKVKIKRPMIRTGRLEDVDYDKALQSAVRILLQAKRPLIFGLDSIGYMAQKIALDIAREVRGVYVSDNIVYSVPFYLEARKRGIHFASLEEIKDRADLVIFWGCNPLDSHLRLLSRFSVYPRGRFIERGIQDRTLISVGIDDKLSRISNLSIHMEPGTDQEVSEALRRLLLGDQIGSFRGDIEALEGMAYLVGKASYGVIFFGSGISEGTDARGNIKSLFSLVDSLNHRAQFVLFPMDNCGYNANGVVQLLLREVGSPLGADFSKDPLFKPGETELLEILDKFDAALVVGADPASTFPPGKVNLLERIPVILLDPFVTSTVSISDVVFPVAITGVEAEDIAYKMDGLPLKLKRIIDCEYPSDCEVLSDIYSRLRGNKN